MVTDESGVARLEWRVDGVLRSTAAGFTHDFGRTSRTAPVVLTAWDTLGNLSTASVDVAVDASGPAVTWISPRSGALVRGSNITSTIEADDNYSGAVDAVLSGGVRIRPCTVCTSRTASGAEGKKVLVWTVTDGVGNQTVARRTVLVDNTKPKLKVTKAPRNKAKVKGPSSHDGPGCFVSGCRSAAECGSLF